MANTSIPGSVLQCPSIVVGSTIRSEHNEGLIVKRSHNDTPFSAVALALRNIISSIKPFSVYAQNNPAAKLRLEADQMPVACVSKTCLASSLSNLATVLA